MLTNGEQRMANNIFWLLFFLSAALTIGGYVLLIATAVYLVQALIMYFRIAKEDWQYTPGIQAQFRSTQRFYWRYLLQVIAPNTADADQAFLDAHSGGRTLREWLLEWSKRLIKAMTIILAWLPAMIVHAVLLGFGKLFRLTD